jgi:glycosyltransferase involved in cell wall biosynthesis
MVANTIKILQDEDLHTQMKANALARAKEFSLEKILPMYERYYEKIVGQSWRFPAQKFSDSE